LGLKYIYIYIYIYIWLYTSCEVKKPSGVSSVKWKALGYPERVRSAGTSVALVHGRFRLAVCMIVEVFV